MLPCVENAAQNTFLAGLAGDVSRAVPLAFTDAYQDGEWRWSGGACDSTYINWNSGEPNNLGDEDFAYVRYQDGKWNDADANSGNALCICQERLAAERHMVTSSTSYYWHGYPFGRDDQIRS